MIFSPLTFMIGFIMNLMNELYYKCEMREYHSLYSRNNLELLIQLTQQNR